MADEKKRSDPQELHRRQKEIERLAAEEKARKDAELSAAAEAKRHREIQGAIHRARTTWRDGVEDAFQKPNVRFVVVAKVHQNGRQAAAAFVNEVRQVGFLCEITPTVLFREPPKGVPKDAAQEVDRGHNELGWCLAGVPTIGSGPASAEEYLIVKLPPV